MDYRKHYNMLIERGRVRPKVGYMERHHIIPKCLGGKDDVDNLVFLTPEEHYTAHLLLVKLYPKCGPLVNAAIIMTTHNTDHRINNKMYGWLRRRASDARKQHILDNGHPKGMLGKKHDINNIPNVTIGIRKSSHEKKIAVYAYELDGSFYKKFDSITDCATDLNTSPSNVKYTAGGNFDRCKNKQLRYEYTEQVPPYVKKPSSLKGKQKTEEHCKNISDAKTGKKQPEGWGERHSAAMKKYHARKKEL